MLRLKLMLARLVRAMSRRLGRGGGTTLPGRLLLRLDKRAIGRLGQRGSRPEPCCCRPRTARRPPRR